MKDGGRDGFNDSKRTVLKRQFSVFQSSFGIEKSDFQSEMFFYRKNVLFRATLLSI